MAIDLKNYSAYLIGNVSAVKRKSTATVIVTQVSICTYESYFFIIRFFIFFFEHMIRAKREKRKSISIEMFSCDLSRIYVIRFSFPPLQLIRFKLDTLIHSNIRRL